MSKLIILSIGVLAIGGCATKSSHIALAGAGSTGDGLAIGPVEIQSAPAGAESAMVRYEDSEARFRDDKGHRIRTPLTGTNSVDSADSIVKDICRAFAVAANIDGVSAAK